MVFGSPLYKTTVLVYRPDTQWWRLHSLVSDALPMQGVPPPNSFCSTLRYRVCEPTSHALLHSDQSLNSVQRQSAKSSSGSFSKRDSDSNRFFRGVFRTTNRFSLGSDEGGSRIETAFLTLPDAVERSGILVFWSDEVFFV